MTPIEAARAVGPGGWFVLDYLHAVRVGQPFVRKTITIGDLGRTLRTILFARRR